MFAQPRDHHYTVKPARRFSGGDNGPPTLPPKWYPLKRSYVECNDTDFAWMARVIATSVDLADPSEPRVYEWNGKAWIELEASNDWAREMIALAQQNH